MGPEQGTRGTGGVGTVHFTFKLFGKDSAFEEGKENVAPQNLGISCFNIL